MKSSRPPSTLNLNIGSRDMSTDAEPTQHGVIKAIYVARAHNYFGHHGETPSQHPMIAVNTAECLAGKGLMGDRFFDFKANYKGQLTFFATEVFERLRKEIPSKIAEPWVFRRNILTMGMDLNHLIGKRFRLQGILMQGTEECRPCYWMNQAWGPGAEKALQGHGGLRVKVLEDGVLSVGQAKLSLA